MSRLHLLIFLLLCVDRSCGLNNKHVVYMLRVMNGDKQWICEKRYSVSATVCCASVSIAVVQHAGQPVHSWNSRACNTKEHAGAHTRARAWCSHIAHSHRLWNVENKARMPTSITERRKGRLTIPFAPTHTQDFMMLDEVLRSKFWYTAVPKLPGKKMFFNLDDDFIKKRKKELETYLKEVLQVACFSQSDELWQFFTDSRSIVGVPPELEEENARHAQVLPEQEPEE